jgi:hypothetical protein
MSRTYSIPVPIELIIDQDKLNRLKSFHIGFTLLEILPMDEMLDILKEKLINHGFKLNGDSLDTTMDESEIVFSLENLSLEIKLNIPAEQNISFTDDVAGDMERLALLKDSIANNISIRSGGFDGLELEYAQALADIAVEAKALINTAIKETYKDAVIAKASQLGNLEHISETSEDGVYKVRIEIEG